MSIMKPIVLLSFLVMLTHGVCAGRMSYNYGGRKPYVRPGSELRQSWQGSPFHSISRSSGRDTNFLGHGRSRGSGTLGLRTVQVYHQAATGASRYTHSRRPAQPRTSIYASPIHATNNDHQIRIIKILHEGSTVVGNGLNEHQGPMIKQSLSYLPDNTGSDRIETIRILQDDDSDIPSQYSAVSSGASKVKTIKIVHEAAHQHRNGEQKSGSDQTMNYPTSNRDVVIKVMPDTAPYESLYPSSKPKDLESSLYTTADSDLRTVKTLRILHAIGIRQRNTNDNHHHHILRPLDYDSVEFGDSTGPSAIGGVAIAPEDESAEEYRIESPTPTAGDYEESSGGTSNWW